MKKHLWENAWEKKTFSIETLTPSVLVQKYSHKLVPGDRVLDVGCGNGRNSIYLAKQGCLLDSFDIADIGWFKPLDETLKKSIHFSQHDILGYPYAPDTYKAAILARVIQYLNYEELIFLFDRIKRTLKRDGFLLLSYNTKGGVFNKKEINVPKYRHSIEEIESLLRQRFANVVIEKGSNKSTHVNFEDSIESYDIYAAGPIGGK